MTKISGVSRSVGRYHMYGQITEKGNEIYVHWVPGKDIKKICWQINRNVCMALSTDQAPIYGGSTLTIEFPNDQPLLSDASYYLIYEGSQQRHVTTARLLSTYKLHTITPGHNEAEQVQLSVVCCHGDSKDLLVTSPFHFYCDGAYYLAQFLVDSVYNPVVLEDLELVKSDHFDLANEDLATLDQRLSRSLAHLDFPDWWNLLGPDANQANPEPRESVLHFAARLGLTRVAGFMIGKPGSRKVIQLQNKNGDLPKDVAFANQNYGLAELLSEYNAHGFMPLSQWFETEKGIVQPQETGDVTLTSKLLTHQRTLEEDIAVLKDIQQQLDEDRPLRQWQTDWPSTQTNLPDETIDLPSRIERKVEAIRQKTQNLPNIISLESITNNNDYDGQNDSGMGDLPDHLGEAENHTTEHEIEENTHTGAQTGNLPNLHISEENEMDVMDECLSGLHRYNEDLLRIRGKSVVFNRILEQDIRKENLARFSSSCPSLDVESRESPLPVIDEADHCKSMVDLADGDDQPHRKAESGSLYSEDHYSSDGDLQEPSVSIVVDGVTTGSTDDFGQRTQEYDAFLKEYYGGNIPSVRRRSFSPNEVNRQVADSERQTNIPHVSPTMLLDGEKRNILSEGDSEEDVLSGEDHEDIGISNEPHIRLSETRGKSLGDMPNDDSQDISQDVGQEEMHPRFPGVLRSPGSSRPQSGNKARFSADIEYLMRQQKDHHSGGSMDQSQVSPHSGNSTEDEPAVLKYAPHSKMTKALSTPSIPLATKAEKYGGSLFSRGHHDGKHALFRRQREIEEDDGAGADGAHSYTSGSGFLNSRRRKKAQVSLLDFLNDPSNFSSDSSSGPLSPAAKKEKEKEEKKRKTSRFSLFQSSIRQKKPKDKDVKGKLTHKFISASVSNSMLCDVCGKALANKPALKCEICLVNIHEHSCKDNVSACDRQRYRTKQELNESSTDEPVDEHLDGEETSPPPFQYGHGRQGSGDGDNVPVSNLRPSYSFKEKQPRQQQPFVGATSQPLPIPLTPSPSEVQQDYWRRQVVMRKKRTSMQQSAQLNRRSLPSRAIAEELDHDSRLGLTSNITDTISHSVESLDELDVGQHEFLCNDNILLALDSVEPETWSETADKKTQKKLHLTAKDIKRQDTIWELIQTERQYCKRLRTLQLFFRDGMIKELNMDSIWVEQLFPQLDDLMNIHMAFLTQLRDLQRKREDHLVEEIGPVLVSQFSGESASRMKYSYGVFCSGHLEAVQSYKDMVLIRRDLYSFIKQCSSHPICGKREPPDFILLITQRPTKYPTLIEAIIKNTKDKKDHASLQQALALSKDILQNVNEQIAVSERQMRLQDIYQRLDGRSYTIHRGKKFRKTDLKSNGRKLLHEGMVGWKRAAGKFSDVLAIVLTDVLIFLQESNQKYSFYSQDNKHGIVSLFNLLVREKGDTKDSLGLYLISQNKQDPEMYEIQCSTPNQRQEWAKALRAAVEKCPEEEDEGQMEEEEERRRQEEKMAKAKKIMDDLHAKDEEIKQCCDAKNKLMIELLKVYSDTDTEGHGSRPNSHDFEDASTAENMGVLQAAIQNVSAAASQLTDMLHGSGTNLSRSVSSVGEHTSSSYTAVPVPKRAETFAGFDSSEASKGKRVPIQKKKGTDVPDYTTTSDDSLYDKDTSQSDISQHSELSGPQQYRYEGIDQDSGRGSSLSAISSASTLSPTSANQGPMDQSSIKQLLTTLNSIVHLTASQGTAVETLRAQLAEANERINKLSADMHERKGGYKHSQLEELRNLQTTVQKEKQDWERQKVKELQMIEAERAQLEEMRSILATQETEIKAQKEELKKQREVLQKQTEMLREQGKLPRDLSLSRLTTGSSSDSESTDSSKGQVQSQSDFIPGHKRSASAELSGKSEHSNGKENFRNEHKSLGSKTQSFSIANKNMPVHLMSATNELKIGSKNLQQLPSKLSSTVSSPQQVAMGGALQAGLSKLAPGIVAGGNGNIHSSHGNSSPSLVSEGGAGGDASNLGHLGHSSSASHLGNHGNSVGQGQQNNYGSSVTVPMGNRQSNRPKPSVPATTGIAGLLKLSEKGDKKGKSSSQLIGADKGSESPPQGHKQSPEGQQRPKSVFSQQRSPNISHKPQKSDSDVIYF